MQSKSLATLCVLALICLFVPSITKADSVTVENPDFAPGPTPTQPCGGGCVYNTGPISGWSATAGTIDGSFIPTSTQFTSTPGGATTAAYINGNTNSGQVGTLSQDLGVAVLPNTTYTLSVYVGDRADMNFVTTYEIGLDAGSTLLASSGWLSNGPAFIPTGSFGLETVTFSTGSSVDPGDLTVFVSAQGFEGDFTGVSLSAVPAPEPSSLIMLSIGLIGLLGLAKRYGFKPASQLNPVS